MKETFTIFKYAFFSLIIGILVHLPLVMEAQQNIGKSNDLSFTTSNEGATNVVLLNPRVNALNPSLSFGFQPVEEPVEVTIFKEKNGIRSLIYSYIVEPGNGHVRRVVPLPNGSNNMLLIIQERGLIYGWSTYTTVIVTVDGRPPTIQKGN